MQGAATLQLFYFTEEFGGVGFTVPTANLITKFQDLLEETDKIQTRNKNRNYRKFRWPSSGSDFFFRKSSGFNLPSQCET